MNIDPKEVERQYSAMTEAELQELARSYESLTEPAQAVLRAEFARRGMEAPILEEASDLSDAGNLVTIRRYRDLSEAIVARSLLESSAIRVYLYDENLVRLDWQVSNFIGGIRLQVESGDVDLATSVLDQPVPDSIAYEGDSVFNQPRCPHCTSTNITFEGSSRKAALASLYVFALPLPLGQETWTCNDCGTRWEDVEAVD